MKKQNIVITVLSAALAILCLVFFEIMHLPILKDELANRFLTGFISRIGIAQLFCWLLYLFGGKDIIFCGKKAFMGIIWSLPCFMVAFVNFPYSAIINRTVTIDRSDLIGLFALYIIGIALLEEVVFRGVLFVMARDYFKNKRHAPIWITLVSALIFSLFHLTNLISPSPDVPGTLLQCLYTFLIGAMLTVVMLKLKNIYLCFVIHAIFDFCGLLIVHLYLGPNSQWDTLFWILTIVSGVLAAGHIIYSLIKLDKAYVSRD